MAYEFATYEKQGRIAIVTLNRPERMNALHPPAHFSCTKSGTILSVILRFGSVFLPVPAKAFSAGNDLKYTAEHGRRMVRSAEAGFGGITNRTTCWKPIIAAEWLCSGWWFRDGVSV